MKKVYDTKYPYMANYPFSESADEKRMLDEAVKVALGEQILPEEIDIESYGITMDCSPPLRSKSAQPMSPSDEEDMNNLLTVADVMDE